jgi:hypothetical protein
MHGNDIETMAHDLYEFHLYETIRAQYPDATPAEVAMRVIGALEMGDN